jgi:hypothetical protein
VPTSIGFAESGVSAAFPGISGSLGFAEEPSRRQDRLVSSNSIMATIQAGKQADGTDPLAFVGPLVTWETAAYLTGDRSLKCTIGQSATFVRLNGRPHSGRWQQSAMGQDRALTVMLQFTDIYTRSELSVSLAGPLSDEL